MIDAKQLIRELYEKTGIRVSASDPVLAMVVANDIQFCRTMETVEQQMKLHCRQVIALVDRAPAKAEEAAVAMLNRTADWADERIKMAADAAVAQIMQAGETVAASITREMQNKMAHRAKFNRLVKSWGKTALILVVLLAIAWPVGVMIGNMLPLPAKH
jgi:hypothetical protein